MSALHAQRHVFQTGLSLIEIMVALTLGIIIMLGVTEVATNNSITRGEIERTGRQIESASYALQQIENDLLSAGFWGEMGEQGVEIDTLNNAFPVDDACTAPTAAELAALPAVPVCPGLAADSCDARVEMVRSTVFPVDGADEAGSSCVVPKAGTDFLAIRRVSSCALLDTDGTDNTSCDDSAGNFHLQVNSCFDPLDDAYPLPGIDFRIDKDLDNLNYPVRLSSCPILTAYTPPAATDRAPIYRFVSRVYFVSSIVDADGNEIDSRLVRAELDLNQSTDDYDETELVEGVELMSLEYGIDSNGDGQIDVYTNAPVGVQWADIVMVRISLVVRNLQPSAGFTDNKTYTVLGATHTVPAAFADHRRQVYTRTVSLRNVAGRRET
jgi:type IV pilus assembly protein PilW